jgi:hypothetical protein
LAKGYLTSSMKMSCIIAVHEVSFNDASPSRKVKHYFSTFMKEYVDITLHQEAWLVKLFDKVFKGQQPLMTGLRL